MDICLKNTFKICIPLVKSDVEALSWTEGYKLHIRFMATGNIFAKELKDFKSLLWLFTNYEILSMQFRDFYEHDIL